MRIKFYRGSFIGGGVLFALGVVALLRYFGVVNSTWRVFWPAALVIIGLGLMFGRWY